MSANSEFVIHISIRAVVSSAIVIGSAIAGGAWSVASSNTHVSEALISLDRTNNRQEQVIQTTATVSKANAARLDVLDSRTSRLENDVNDLRQQVQRGAPR